MAIEARLLKDKPPVFRQCPLCAAEPFEPSLRGLIQRPKRSWWGDARAYDNRGSAYDDQLKFDKAISDYNEAIRLDPSDAAAYDNRGVAYSRAGDYNKADADFATAKRLRAGQ
jgi:tetratricopeptide (TPR) repeat protein